MGQKNYLDQSYIKEFEAEITELRETDTGVFLTLKDNYFYPESGGQPADKGSIGNAQVLDVQLDGEDVVIQVDKKPDGNKAVVDWSRRYDHMQQHTAQHLLSSVLIKLYDADTLAFHLGEEASTIDISLSSLSYDRITSLEEKISAYIRQTLPVIAETVTVDEFKAMPLRKKALPDHITGNIRLIHISDVDTAHCGGTHLRSTAEIQLLKIIGTENVKENVRVHFIAGDRAIKDYSRKHRYLTKISDDLTCSVWDIDRIIEKTRAENKENSSKLRKISKELASYKAAEDLESAQQAGEFNIIVKDYEGLNPGELKAVASEMTAKMASLLFCGISSFNGKAALVLAAGDKFQGDLGPVCREVVSTLNGKGGGRGNFAQGMGELENLNAALEKALEILRTTGMQQ